MGELVFLPLAPQTPEQRQYWVDQAAYWDLREEEAQTALDYAHRQREAALRVLGMIKTEAGPDG